MPRTDFSRNRCLAMPDLVPMTESLRRVTGSTALAIDRWLATSESRGPAAKPQATPSALPSSVAALSKQASPEAVGNRLDALHRQMQAEYRVDGKQVRVTPSFRSLHGVSAQQQSAFVSAIKKQIGTARFAEIAPQVLGATSTRGTPEDIRITTQALLDKGAATKLLEKHPDLPREQAVRMVMGANGIGLDCRGCTLRAFLHSRGTGSHPARMNRYFDKGAGDVLFQSESRLRRISADLSTARTGDVVRLKPGADGRDHNVIVRSNDLRRLPPTGEMSVLGNQVPASFVTKGTAASGEPSVRVITVDSSWGGGGDPTHGGVRRMAWLHNEKSGEWGHWDHFGRFQTGSRPYDHDVDGIFRPRGEQ